MTADEDKGSENDKRTKLPFWKTLLSVMQASFGVQSSANKERDFANGSVKGFIVAALVFTALFILTLVLVVRSVLT